MAALIDPTMAIFDPTTFEASRLMFWASCCSDGEYVFRVFDNPFIDADGLLATYSNWRDASQWPRVPTEDKNVQRELKAQQDPTTKRGDVGVFCRVYDVYRAMDEHLPGVYEPVDSSTDRYTFMGGSTTGGAVVYEGGKFLYSHHSTDPCSGKLVNAFDLVRLHKFGDLDDDAKDGTPMTSLPSYMRMVQYAQSLPEVQELFEKELGGAPEDFYGVGNVVAEGLINPLSDKKRYTFNDMGNGFLFADLAVNILRYCPQAKGWYVYTGGKWQPDIGDATTREYAKRMSDYLFHFVSGASGNGAKLQ
jgi:hypothetical protein